jgi:acylaminoacyl-peptidase
VTDLNRSVLDEIELRAPIEKWVEVDGWNVQSWLIPGGDGKRPGVLEIHGGPHTLYGWSPFWEFQLLAGAGISVLYTNPRGSEGYGLAFNEANRGDWGDGPMRDVIACVDAFVADGLLDANRLGVTGGSYGGYLTSWIVGHTDRFRAAISERAVNNLLSAYGSSDWFWAFGKQFGAWGYEAPDTYLERSPDTYAADIATPLLILHSENDLRCNVEQAERLFITLRLMRKDVELLRFPGESHELSRSGSPLHRVLRFEAILEWFERKLR